MNQLNFDSPEDVIRAVHYINCYFKLMYNRTKDKGLKRYNDLWRDGYQFPMKFEAVVNNKIVRVPDEWNFEKTKLSKNINIHDYIRGPDEVECESEEDILESKPNSGSHLSGYTINPEYTINPQWTPDGLIHSLCFMPTLDSKIEKAKQERDDNEIIYISKKINNMERELDELKMKLPIRSANEKYIEHFTPGNFKEKKSCNKNERTRNRNHDQN
jgi:hypothetical protein